MKKESEEERIKMAELVSALIHNNYTRRRRNHMRAKALSPRERKLQCTCNLESVQ